MSKKTKPDLMISKLIQEFEHVNSNRTRIQWEEKALLKLINHYERINNFEKALEVIDFALLTFTVKSEFYLHKAQILIALQKPLAAIDILEQALKNNPEDSNLILYKAKAFCTMGEFATALNLIEDIKRSQHKADDVEILLVEAFIQESMKDYDQMFYKLQEALKLNPNNTEALEQIWISVEISKKFEESIRLHKELIDNNPYSYLAWYNLGHAYSCLGMYQQALEALDYSYLINPHFEQACMDCAELALQENLFEKALEYFTEASERFGEDSDLSVNIVECLIKLKRFKEAKSKLHKAITQDPYNDELFYYLGECYSEEKNWTKAIKYYKESLEIDPEREEFHFGIAKVFEMTGNLRKAEFHYRRASYCGQEQSQYWARYISFLIKNNLPEKAQKALLKSDKVSTGADLLYCKAAFHYLQGDEKKTISILEEALVDDFPQRHIFEELAPEFASGQLYTSMLKYFIAEIQ